MEKQIKSEPINKEVIDRIKNKILSSEPQPFVISKPSRFNLNKEKIIELYKNDSSYRSHINKLYNSNKKFNHNDLIKATKGFFKNDIKKYYDYGHYIFDGASNQRKSKTDINDAKKEIASLKAKKPKPQESKLKIG